MPVRASPSANAFGEIERPTTNQIPSLLRSLPEDFPCQAPKYESDVSLSQPALAQRKTGMSPGSSRNRCSIEQANGVGMNGETKFFPKAKEAMGTALVA